MKKLAIFAIGALTAGMAQAAGLRFGEPGFPGSAAPAATTWRQSCSDVQRLVSAHGHAVLTYREFGYNPATLLSAVATFGSYGYDRVVSDGRYCLSDESVRPIWVRTRDVNACFAGFTCASGDSAGGKWGR